MSELRHTAAELETFLVETFTRHGLPPSDAARLAGALVLTSLRGVDTHGIRLAPTYLRLLASGRAQRQPEMRFEKRGGSVGILEADRALGHLAGFRAMEHAQRLADEQGIGLVLVRNSNHFGAAACFTLPLAADDKIGFASTNADRLVSPFQGREAFFGTNPIAIAAPGEGDEIFSLDMATSQIAFSRVKRHRETGESLPLGWAIDSHGEFTADALNATALAPLGGYKGAGLALAVQVLTAVLAGGSFDHELAHVFDADAPGPSGITHLVGAIDIRRFGEPSEFRARLSRLLQALRAQSAIIEKHVRAPGDPEKRAFEDRSAKGIPVDAAWWEEMRSVQ